MPDANGRFLGIRVPALPWQLVQCSWCDERVPPAEAYQTEDGSTFCSQDCHDELAASH